MIILNQLHIYPVKSLGGISISGARVEARGLEHDRRWMVVDGDNKFLTQREYPRMALVSPQVSEEGLALTAPGMEALRVPPVTEGETVMVRVWRSVCEAVSVGDEAAEWLTRYLGVPVRLMFYARDDAARGQPGLWAARRHRQLCRRVPDLAAGGSVGFRT